MPEAAFPSLRRFARHALRLPQLALFPERNPMPVALLTRSGGLLYSNPAWQRLRAAVGAASDDARAMLPDDLERRIAEAWEHEVPSRRWEYELGGSTFECRVQVLRDRGLAHVYLEDVSERRRAERLLLHQTRHDGLTGLPNRASLEDRLQQSLRGGELATGLLLLDLDRHGVVIDSLGPRVGDALLQATGVRLAASLARLAPGWGDVFRFEGDSFAVLLSPLPSAAAAARVAKDLVAAMRAPVPIGGRALRVTLSAGLTLAAREARDPLALVREAQLALHRVQKQGGDGYTCYSAELDQMARDWLGLEGGLREALDGDGLSVAYQPQFEIPGLTLVGHEALARWTHAERGSVAPARFIPVAEESGLIGALGDWVLRRACHEMGTSQAGGQAAVLAVNVSARQLADAGLPERVAGVLAETGMRPGSLEIEITETAAMSDPAAASVRLEALHRLGVRIAIDDFGTGHSSLAYLSRFPLDRLKIDASFVQGLGRGSRDETIVATVVEMGHRLGLRVLAEGVETEEQLGCLASFGCDEAQGFLLGRPQALHAGRASGEAAGL